MNPYQAKLTKAENRLERLKAERDRHSASDLPGTFITGRSGVPASRIRTLDRQLERTIDNAVEIVKATNDVEWLRVKRDLFEQGLIHANGRPVSTKPPVKNPRPAQVKARAKALREAQNTIEAMGVAKLKTGHAIGIYSRWWAAFQAVLGLIVVYDGETVTYHIAKSIQGIHTSETLAQVLDDLIATVDDYEGFVVSTGETAWPVIDRVGPMCAVTNERITSFLEKHITPGKATNFGQLAVLLADDTGYTLNVAAKIVSDWALLNGAW